MEIKYQKTKTLITRDNSRSSDAIAPNFIYGCLGGCMSSYCYVGRFNNDKIFINENIESILHSIDMWFKKQSLPKKPNQVDGKYYCVDIGCSTDVALHYKYYDWQRVFDFFNERDFIKSTFATKYPTKFRHEMFKLDKNKHRIRISLMPQKISNILEPNTDKIIDRINMIPILQERMEVHINFSPIVYYDTWLEDYKELFELLKSKNIDVKCECIFLTYNENQAILQKNDLVKSILYNPNLQESKNSEYAADNLRYKWQLKEQMINQFKQLYIQYFPHNNIRYIF